MTSQEFLNKLKDEPKIGLHIIVQGNRPGVIRTLKAYQIPVDENATNEQLVDTIVKSAEKCKSCILEIMLLRIKPELLPEGYAETLDALGLLDPSPRIESTKQTRFGSSFDKLTFQGQTVVHNGIVYVWNENLKMYVIGVPSNGNDSDAGGDANATTDEDPRLNWSNIITGGLAAVSSIFSSGVVGGGNQQNNTIPAPGTPKKDNTVRNIAIGLVLIVIVVVVIYFIKQNK